MHAYLVVGKSDEAKEKNAYSLAKELKAKLMVFDFGKISDVKEIAKFTNLYHPEKFAILLKDVDKASLEASNAFLKNLEEPQKSIVYILTSDSILSVLPTIVSRCQVIKLGETKLDKKTADKMLFFINLDTAQKLNHLMGIKDRGEALQFLESLITATHQGLLTSKEDLTLLSTVAKSAELARVRIEGNGNVNLQLTSFAISMN